MAEGASPISSGGAGTVYEYHVAALDLVALLCCLPVPGLDVSPDEVGLQKASTAPLDDIVATNTQGPYPLRVERQVKRTLEIIPSAKSWKGLIDQCLKSLDRYGADVDADRRRFGVTAAGPIEDMENLRELAATAAAHDALATFHDDVLPSQGKQYHEVWTTLKKTVAKAMTSSSGEPPTPELVELTAFRIVRRLVVQIEPAASGDRYRYLCAALEDRLIPAGAAVDGAEVFRIVEKLAGALGPRGGTVTREMLRNQLTAKGLVLKGDPPARADLKAAEEATDTFLNRPKTKDQLGGRLHLDRAALRAELTSTIATHKRVLVTGPAGTGKSALTRTVARELRLLDHVTVVGLSLTEHTWRTVADIDGDLGGRFVVALRGAPTGRRVLVVDGAEQALTDDGRLLTDLLSLLPRDEDGEALWHVVAVAREQAADAVSRHLADWGGQVETMTVGDLTAAEMREVLTAFPGLMALARSPRAARLLHTLYTVELLVRLFAAGADPGQFLGEEDVADLVYKHLVCRGQSVRPELGYPDDRSDLFLDLAQAALAGERTARLRSGTAPAKAGLVSDGILVRESSVFAFSHDVMQDYAVATLLSERNGPDPATARFPRQLLRGVRIAAQIRLARAGQGSPADTVAAWKWINDIARRLSGGGSDPRWLDVPFEALFELGRPEPVLSALAEVLLADGGRALVDAARLRLRTVVPALPLLKFLTLHAADLDEAAAAGALHLLGRWLPDPLYLDDEELAAAVPPAVATWFHTGSQAAQSATIALARTARHLDAASQQTFEEICQTEPLAVQQVLENASLAENMARHAPELLTRASRAFYLGQGTVSFREGVQDLGWPSVYRPAAIDQLPVPVPPSWVPPTAPDPSTLGPFEALLAHAPELGLALAGQIVDAATEAVTRIETERGGREFSLVWPLDQGDKAFTGTARSWEWPWTGAAGPGPALAAAARLRRWAHDQAAAGADLGELVEQVLGSGRSIALAAIAVGVLALNPLRVDRGLDAVLGQWELWELPSSAAVQLAYAVPLIVLRSPGEQQDAYRAASHRLSDEYERRRTVGGAEATRRANVIAEAALLLDSSNYGIVELPDGGGRTVANHALLHWRETQKQTFAFEEFIERYALLNDAELARDGTEATDPTELFNRWIALDRAHQLDPEDRPAELDKIGAMVAAAVVRAAPMRPGAVEPGQLRWAASGLLAAAVATPCAVTAGWEVEKRNRDPRGSDRSAAMGLPVLLSDPALLEQAGATEEAVRAAVLRLAGSAYIEVRTKLCETITQLWDTEECAGPGNLVHRTGIEALREAVCTAGLTVQEDMESPRESFRLPEPVESALAEGTAFVDLRLAADAAAAAHLAAASNCTHSGTAQRLAEALTEHDRLTWTSQTPAMAAGSTVWRHTHDAITSKLALDGDRARLHAHLAAFDEAPRALAGLLQALAEQAVSQGRVQELLRLWPDFLNRYAPRGTAELGRALLPRPADRAAWTPAQARGVLHGWAALHTARPQLADHLIAFLNDHDLFGGPEVTLVLDVMGQRTAAVAMCSSRVAPFLRRALSGEIHRQEVDERARRLLDALAAQGHEEALRVQHALEESSGLT